MSEIISITGMGLTERQRDALAAITEFAARHGVMPSRRQLATALGCNPNNANRLIAGLVERGMLNSISPGGMLSGFGSEGVAVFIPAHVAAALAAYCAANGERVPAVVADAVTLHLDAVAGVVSE